MSLNGYFHISANIYVWPTVKKTYVIKKITSFDLNEYNDDVENAVSFLNYTMQINDTYPQWLAFQGEWVAVKTTFGPRCFKPKPFEKKNDVYS